jgi:hypothetical protein
VVSGIHIEKDKTMITLYAIVTYLITLGMLIQSFTKSQNVPTEAWFTLAFSPITLPIIIGMEIADKRHE